MPTVRIMLAPSEVMREAFGYKGTELFVNALPRYLVLPPMTVLGKGEAVAEEVFDLTNNPSRQDERMERYGNGRSLSTGDIVDVDGEKFVCLSFGWAKVL